MFFLKPAFGNRLTVFCSSGKSNLFFSYVGVLLLSLTRSKQRERTLRLSGNHAVSNVEEQLCTVHRRALNALIKSRDPSDLLRGYEVKKMGRR